VACSIKSRKNNRPSANGQPTMLQAWFADDAFESVREWYDKLAEKEPAFGYFPSSSDEELLSGG
jgi:hypothetical protein